jgi:hypothetical protein
MYSMLKVTRGGTYVNFERPVCLHGSLQDRLAATVLGGFFQELCCMEVAHREVFLSPLLWCLIDDLIARLSVDGIYTEGYAGDICLLAVGRFPYTVSGLIQWALRTEETWCDEVGLSVNPDKTGLVVFTRRREPPGFFEQHLFGVTLRRSMSVKYLGVVLYSRLT